VSSYWTPGTARYAVSHPASAAALARAGWRLRRSLWWRRAPFLPLPDRRYWSFRMVTAYGTAGARPTPEALVEVARWSLRQRVGK
jgi:hypothetical protein